MIEDVIYIFVRGDLPESDALIQAAHAVFKMATLNIVVYTDVKIVALDGGSSDEAFRRTVRKLTQKDVQHVAYTDSDKPALGITAICCTPVKVERGERHPQLENYRLRRIL